MHIALLKNIASVNRSRWETCLKGEVLNTIQDAAAESKAVFFGWLWLVQWRVCIEHSAVNVQKTGASFEMN